MLVHICYFLITHTHIVLSLRLACIPGVMSLWEVTRDSAGEELVQKEMLENTWQSKAPTAAGLSSPTRFVPVKIHLRPGESLLFCKQQRLVVVTGATVPPVIGVTERGPDIFNLPVVLGDKLVINGYYPLWVVRYPETSYFETGSWNDLEYLHPAISCCILPHVLVRSILPI